MSSTSFVPSVSSYVTSLNVTVTFPAISNVGITCFLLPYIVISKVPLISISLHSFIIPFSKLNGSHNQSSAELFI